MSKPDPNLVFDLVHAAIEFAEAQRKHTQNFSTATTDALTERRRALEGAAIALEKSSRRRPAR